MWLERGGLGSKRGRIWGSVVQSSSPAWAQASYLGDKWPEMTAEWDITAVKSGFKISVEG